MKTVLVTGANSGLGFELTRKLVAGGDKVIMAVRDVSRGNHARDVLLREQPSAQLQLVQVDLADLKSVRALGEQDLLMDVLVNNAGVGNGPKALTAEGVINTFAANHLGHFVLTALLLDRISSRVVTVSSGFGKRGKLDLDNLDGSKGYGQGRAYIQSKLANTLFGAELDRRLRARGSPVTSVLAHPGVARTEMQQKPKGVMGVLSRIVSATLAKPASHGAAALYVAATGASAGGDIWGPGKRLSEAPRKEARWPAMDDRLAAAALWQRSEALSGLTFLR